MVMKEMILQVCRDYNGIPDYRTMDHDEIEIFYNQLRPELIKSTRSNG